ncbi:aspartyl protease family protein [Pricia sp.]|uniref:aspartyl protease family protein n=1 Tax=Pricia sp. TaxID=2268138 RepID=UPI0035935794
MLKTRKLNRFLSNIAIIILLLPVLGIAQTFHLPEGQKFEKLKFRLINNLMIIPMEVNGTELSFILDSGVDKPILFNLSDQDSVQINNVSEISIKGLGDGEPIKALRSHGNTFKTKNIANRDQQLYVVLDKTMNFSTTLGIPIHGIIGYDLFRDFVVEIDYGRNILKFHDPTTYVHRKNRRQEILPLAIIQKKAYIDGNLILKGELPVRLLVDTGSSDAIWLFENGAIHVPDTYYEDFLGKGLNGNIFGKRTKVDTIQIGRFVLKDAKAAFPDKKSFGAIKNLGSRNGSVGGEVLKRFNIIFDYGRNTIALRKNRNFNAPFQYNLSGLSLQHDGVRYISESITDSRGVIYSEEKSFGDVQILFENRTRLSLVPEIIVSGIRAGSPAHEAGLLEGDVILAVNGKRIHRYKIQEVLEMLNEKDGKRVKVQVERHAQDLTFSFVLKDMFKEKW